MKASKAPEKIYLYPSDIPDQEYEAEWGCQPWDENSVEYTRTDVFIDKACRLVENTLSWAVPPQPFPVSKEKLINDFCKSMKGE